MFNTTIHQVHNHDLSIAEKKRHSQEKIALQTELHQSVTPDSLDKAVNIAEDFRQKCALRFFPSENSIVIFSVVSHPAEYDDIITLSLNGHDISTRIDKLDVVSCSKDAVDYKRLIAETIAKSITDAILPKMIEEILTK